MWNKPLYPTIFALLLSLFAFGQDKNPFESIGKKGNVLTLSNGKYEEQFDKDDVQQIGTALVNVRTKQVVRLLPEKETAQRLDNTVSSRFLSVDPLTSQFPFYSPYQYAGNKPIWATDLDGAEELILPRFFIPRPVLTIPRPVAPVQPLPPLPPAMPGNLAMPQTPTLPPVPYTPLPPIAPQISRTSTIDESTIDPNDATTYPPPPFAGEWTVQPLKPGVKGYEKLKEKGATRLENEDGDILRWHKADEQHPKGHWDLKRGGSKNNPWENWTPDGIQIPDGKIYGKDFNPAILNPFSNESLMKLLKQYGEQKEYERKLEQYQKDLKQYEKEKLEYDKKIKQYYKDNPDLQS
ncbi:MAG: hypothetical protein QM664_06000 [Flavihumibacter sp.]